MAFKFVPDEIRVPITLVETDMSAAGTASGGRQPTCLVGQRLTDGTAAAGVPTRVRSPNEADDAFGAGSLLARACRAYLLNDTFGELWAIALDDDGTDGVAAQGRITVGGPATGDGVVPLYVAGQRQRVSIDAGTSATDAAAAIVAAVNANPQLPVTAANASAVITFTAKNKGTLGNLIDLRWCLLGALGGEVLPAGLTLTLTAKMGVTRAGAVNPDVGLAIAAMGDVAYPFIASPYHDSDNLAVWATELGDPNTGRWGWARMLYGGVFSARPGTPADRATWGESQNDPHHYVLGYYGAVTSGGVHVGSPTPPWEVGAAWLGVLAPQLRKDPSAGLEGLFIAGVTPPPAELADNLTERNEQLYAGLSTAVELNGQLLVEKAISTYQVNDLGAEDDSWLDIQTAYTTAAMSTELRRDFRDAFRNHKIVNDGTPIQAGQKLVTPKGLRAFAVTKYQSFMARGWVENIDAFVQHLDVQRNTGNPRRVDLVFPPDLANPFDVMAILMQPRLQYPTA